MKNAVKTYEIRFILEAASFRSSSNLRKKNCKSISTKSIHTISILFLCGLTQCKSTNINFKKLIIIDQ